jgi:hypothetical protein
MRAYRWIMDSIAAHIADHQAFRVYGISRRAAGQVEFSEILTATGDAGDRGWPIYRNAVAGMTAAIRNTGARTVSGDDIAITEWRGHSWAEVEAVLLNADAVD